ncbi:hypothetical protein E1A91_D04G205300v1 [Gossypium mustelinum]|uniref:TF-B3 domain-containing protein n=1 Tax=Gossypium mustelinum TaxID=34275 RepID=A0A5D2VG65_GOSMU|nr:hypothetical protein E1A91_D04G205300v1 [Gossypium mustelinum]
MVFSKSLTGTEIKKSFNRSHAVIIKLMYGTEIWPIVCTIRKKGYKKPVFSGPLWRNFVISKKLRIGDRIRMYKVHDGCSDCRLEVEKPTATSNMELAMAVWLSIMSLPPVWLFGTNLSDETTEMSAGKRS